MRMHCLHHGCPEYVNTGGGSSYCPNHRTEDPRSNRRPYTKGWNALSKRVIRRDGGRCQLRLTGCTGVATTADHIRPKAQGGSDSLDNLRAACRHCNSSAGGSVRSNGQTWAAEDSDSGGGERFSMG